MAKFSSNTILYVPDETPYAGVIQIIHGMAEHQLRYREIAQFFRENRFVVLTSDLRGHGNHVSRETDLGYFGDNAVSRLISDIHDNTAYIRAQFPGIPYVLFGHGIGALLSVIYLRKYDQFLDGLFLDGMPADRLWPRRIMSQVLSVLMLLRGEYHRSSVINYLIMGQYYRPLIREGSEFAWLSKDPDNVRNYEEDPKCGYIYTFNGFKTVLELMDQTYTTSGSWIRKKPDLPIRLFWGSKDPCMPDKNDLSKTIHLFSDKGYQNVAYITYPDQRHEVFRDSRRETAYQDALRELQLICHQKPVPAKTKQKKHIILEDFTDPEVEQPLIRDEKLNLREFINAHNEAIHASDESVRPKVEMVDFAQIDQAMQDRPEKTQKQSDERDPDFDALIDELLNNETYTPGARRPLDNFDGFKIDPDIMDGIH